MAISTEPAGAGMGRFLPLAGAVGVLFVVVSFAVLGGDTPGTEDSAATINSFYDAHSGRQFASALVLAAAAPFLVLFGVRLALALWPADGARAAVWQLTLIAGSAVAGGMFIVSGMLQFALTDAADQDVTGPAALQALNAISADTWVAFNAGLGVLMLGAAGSLLSRKASPVLGWIALAAGIALFIPFADFAGLIVSGLWIIATSIILFRRGASFVPAAA
jgi:hypothetical protein